MTIKAYAAVSLIALASGTGSFAAGPQAEFVRQMNVGKAHLENRNSARAMEAFTAALKLEPKSASGLRNLARAQLLANQSDEAIKLLDRAQSLEKNSPATAYLLGLAHTHQSQFEKAVPFLEEAVRLDAFTPALRFQLATAYQMARQPDKALIQLRETVRLDPLHGSAHFKLGALAAQAGDRAEYEKQQEEFMRLRKLFSDDTRTPLALERCVYTQPEAAPIPAARPSAGIKVRFVDATVEVFSEETARFATAAAVLDIDEKGGYTAFVVDPQGTTALLKMDANGKFSRTSIMLGQAERAPFQQCVVGNFFDDVPKGEKYDATVHARNDVLFVGEKGIRLLKRTGLASFEDVTEAAGLGSAKARRVQWIDYEHDGDIDLLLAAESELQLWQNNGDGRFTNVTEQVGLSGASGAFDAAAVDLDANVAIDLVTARGDQPSLVFMNQRAGRFARMAEPPGPWPPAQRVLANDLDNDGHMDTVLLGEKQALVMFGQRSTRHPFDLSALQGATAALFDFDNDGWLDLCAAGGKSGSPTQGAMQLWRNTGGGNWTDATAATGLATLGLPPIRDVVAADFDGDGDTDLLLLTAAGQMHFLRNEGGNANSQLKLRLVGTKTNPMGLGTRVEVRAGEFRAVRAVAGLPIEIGLGRARRLDSVQMVWANGVVDNQIDVNVKPEPMVIVEKNLATGSCPYLYAWDGRGFRFANDLLGNSPLGLSLRRGVMLPADPEEIVLIGTEKNFRPRRGAYELEVTEELREVLYLDSAKLIALDHAPDVEVHSTDKLGPPPFGPSELWALRSAMQPHRVLGDDGIDRTEAVRAIDGLFAPPGPLLPPPLRGQCEPLTLTMDFGVLHVARPLVLALTGWIQYGDASANIASSQNATLPLIPPRLEVETAEGVWTALDVVVGMPAGKNKTILCDLSGKLPPGAKRLRLTTTFELRWDRIALFERIAETEVERREVLPRSADLRFRGFSEIKSRAPGHPQTPAYDKVSERPPWRTTPQGWCTRYGDVLDLVKSRDERLAILNAGDAVKLRFDAKAFPPVAPGRERTFFFHSVGWDKDADHNVVEGDTVEPLPVANGKDRAAEFNTRWVRADHFSR
jgi:tetratricopeptide (TPR) repeat protein